MDVRPVARRRLPRLHPEACVAVFVAVSVLAGTGLSKYVWGYWFSPPEVAPELGELEQLGFFVQLQPRNSAPELRWGTSALAARELADGAAEHAKSPVNSFDMRLHGAVHERGLRSPLGMLDAGALESIERAVGSSPLLVHGEPGYSRALWLEGYAAGGRTRSGDVLVVLALHGPEVANDHHALYDFAFRCNGSCALLRQQRYFEDVAGIEGVRWEVFSALAALGMMLAGLPFVTVWAAWAMARHWRGST